MKHLLHIVANTTAFLIRTRAVACLRPLLLMVLGLGVTFCWRPASADTPPTLFNSFAGNINFIGTQKTMRTQDNNGDACAITNAATSAALTGLPVGATIRAAYLYWAGSGDTPDYDVTFEGSAVSAPAARRYTATYNNAGTDLNYFSGVADVTAAVTTKGNGTYSFSGLTVDNGNPWCGVAGVVGGWALLVVYAHASEDFRVVNVYEGFQAFRGAAVTLTPTNFQVPVSPINGKDAHLTWEGDVGNSTALNGFNEQLTFNGNVLTDANNPANNQFNSISNVNGDTASHGIDFDVYPIDAYLAAGQTSATTVYSSGGDLVLLSAQIFSATNSPVGDLEISMTRNSALTPGQNATYTLNVINNGPLNEPGPITVTDTLPAGLTYVSGTGTGWTCGVAGQVVTCTRNGSLASGVSANAITLTVAVAAGTSGTKTNTATVDGQAFDNISWNNTATDSYYILPTPYAYYAMDETSWGTVTDSSGNGRNGTVLGAATPTGYPPASPPGSAIAGNPGTCGVGSIPATAGTQGVDTAIDLNSMGNAGTIAFWYNSNTAWNDGNDRMLFDASNELGTNAQDRHFYLVKGDTGRLRFAFEDSNGNGYEARDGTSRTFAAGTWHHIAITWNVGTDVARLYLDGVQVATSAATANALGNTATLYLGDQRNAVGGTPGDFSTNSANGYIDEVRIYSSALSAADVAAVRNLTHSCSLFHHVQIEHGSGAGLTCNSSTVTVRACADAACSSVYTGGVTGTLTATGSPMPTLNWVSGSGFTISSGSSAATKDFQVTTPGSVVFGTSGVTPAPSNATTCNFGTPSCTFTAADSGFVFDVPNHTAAMTQDVTVSAVRKDDATQRCVPAFQSVTRTVNFWSSYLNPNTGTLAVSVAGSNVSGTSPGTGISLAFDANGQVVVPVSYPDVGQMRLSASYSGSGTSAGLVMTGQDDFISKPSRFVLSVSGNPAAADATGSVFKRAGENFTITVQAQNASNAITPNYGRETAAETVKLTPTLVAPAGGNNPALSGGFGTFGQDCSGSSTTAGTACGSTFSWSEVGIITLTPSVGDDDYLGAGNVTGTASGNIGRFTPDHYTFTGLVGGSATITNRAGLTCAPASTFTYLGEPVRMTNFQLEARNSANAITLNYLPSGVAANNFAKLVVTNGASFGVLSSNITLNGVGRLTITANAGNAWRTGANAGTTNTLTIDITGTRAAAPDGEFSGVEFGIAPADTDTIPLLSTMFDRNYDGVAGNDHKLLTATTTILRYGRLAFQNAFGSELVALPVPFRAQYYQNAANGFVNNTDDSCTPVSTGGIDLVNAIDDPAAGTATIIVKTGSPNKTTTASFAGTAMSSGNGGLSFGAPGVGGDGYADVRFDLSAMPWLRYDWDGNGTHDNDPTGRATFGIYKGNPRNIYLRERY